MKYIVKSWIKTEAWDGALIEDTNGNQFLTHGIIKWKLADHRKFEVITPSYDLKQIVFNNWSNYFRYCSLEEA